MIGATGGIKITVTANAYESNAIPTVSHKVRKYAPLACKYAPLVCKYAPLAHMQRSRSPTARPSPLIEGDLRNYKNQSAISQMATQYAKAINNDR